MQSLGKQRDVIFLFVAVFVVYSFVAGRLISLFRRGSLNSALQCLCFAIGLGWLIFVAFKAGYVRQDEHVFITWRILLLSIPVIGVALAPAPGKIRIQLPRGEILVEGSVDPDTLRVVIQCLIR